MIVTQTNPLTSTPHPYSSKPKLRKIGFCIAFLLIIGALVFATYHFGTRKSHQVKPHNLYNSFDESPAHKKLLGNLNKAKLSILYGKKEDGVFKFAEHLANQWTQKGRSVIFEGFSANQFILIQVSKDIVTQVSQILSVTNNTDWVLVSITGQLIPEEQIKEIIKSYPNSKILVVTTNKQQKINGFKPFQYTKLDSKKLLKTITKSYKVKQNVADILHQYYDSHEELFSGLHPQKIDHKELVGDDFKTLQNLNKQEAAILAQLCQKGAKKNKKVKQLQSLVSYGVIYVQGKHIWQNEDKILNYQLNTGSNCINKFATQAQNKAYQERKQKEYQLKKAKEQEQKRQQQMKKAEELKKLQEEQKKQDQLLKKQEESKKGKQSSDKPKKQKGSKRKQEKAAKKK